MKKKIGVIGKGLIGTELIKQLSARRYSVPWVASSKAFFVSDSSTAFHSAGKSEEYFKHIQEVNAVCLAIPTLDNGEIARDYIKAIVSEGKPVVTCEKGALSNHFQELKQYLSRIGFSATVGGGTRLLRWGLERINPEVREIHAVLNGTLNYVFSQVAEGRTLGEVVEEAKKLGYAEPGADSHLEVINTEACRDIPMKTSILLNVLGLADIRAIDIQTRAITERTLQQLVRQARNRRYIVSITRNEREEDIMGGFEFAYRGLTITAGFKHIEENPLFSKLVVSGVNNALLFYEGRDGVNGTYVLSGQGAGAFPTVSSMIRDLENLLEH
jgi:homoserine dehydrogenase